MGTEKPEIVEAVLAESHTIVRRVLADVTDRRGWRQEWGAMDDDTKIEIIKAWDAIVASELA